MAAIASPHIRRHRHVDRPRWGSTILGVILIAVMLFPVYWMVNASLQPSGNTLSGALFPWNPDFAGYERAITEQGSNLVTSLVVALGNVALTLAVAAPAAYALAHFRFRWAKAALVAVVVTQMIPGIIIANAVYSAYTQAGILNTVVGLILAHASLSIPFAILILHAMMLTIPVSIIEAARVDGAGYFRTFFAIVLPVSVNGTVTAALFAFLFSWGDFLFALTLTTDETVRPVTLGIYTYLGTNVQNWSSVMATGVIASLPAIVLLAFAQRYISSGVTGGAVK